MSEKKQLNEEELNEVSGGKDMDKYLPADHGRQLDKYESEQYIGSDVYVVRTLDRELYYWGTLTGSYEKTQIGKWTTRTYKIFIKGLNDYLMTDNSFKGTEQEFSSASYVLFLYK